MKPVDMSPAAITRRLQHVDELRDLCLALAGPRLRRPAGVPTSANVLLVDTEKHEDKDKRTERK